MNQNKFYNFLLLIIFCIGIFIRVWKFPDIPPGINQDEASAIYEAYSLDKTGKDRWGNEYPAYFPGWGSGQNIMLSYLSMPVVHFFGMNIFSARIISLLIGILTLLLFYLCLLPLGRYFALTGLFILAILPWHFMLSRWSLESNLAPFFMLLGIFTMSRALNNSRWIFLSMIPFAFALYSYGTTILILPVFLILIISLHFATIKKHFIKWSLAFLSFSLIAFPFLLFILENYILKKNIDWTDHLFFSTNFLPSTRLEQDTFFTSDVIPFNLAFFLRELNDKMTYNTLQPFGPLSWFILIPGLLGILFIRRNKISADNFTIISLFFAWMISSLVLFILFPLNINRFNHFFIPCIFMATWVVIALIKSKRKYWKYAGILLITGFTIQSSIVVYRYFTTYPDSKIKYVFFSGMKDAFAKLKELKGEQIKISERIPLPYVYALFYLNYPPDRFQKEVEFETIDGVFKVNKIGSYIFFDKALDQSREYYYLMMKDEIDKYPFHNKEVLFTNDIWEVGRVY